MINYRPTARRLRLTTICLTAVAVTAVTAGCGSGSTNAKSGTIAAIKESGTLRVAAPVDPPFIIQNPDGTFDGLDIKLTGLLAKKLGVSVKYTPAAYQNVVAGLQADKYDLIPALCITSAREKVINFTQPTTTVSEVWAVSADSNYHTIKDLNNPSVKFPVATGSLWDTVTTQKMPKANIQRIPGLTISQGLQALQSGRANAIAVETPFYPILFERQIPGKLRYIPGLNQGVESCPVAWGLNKNATDVQKYINEFFAGLQKSGAMKTYLNEASTQLAK